jgi:hypothetical protein
MKFAVEYNRWQSGWPGPASLEVVVAFLAVVQIIQVLVREDPVLAVAPIAETNEPAEVTDGMPEKEGGIGN